MERMEGVGMLAKHEARLQCFYQPTLTTNVSNKSGNLLLAQSYPQLDENVGFLHSRCTVAMPRFNALADDLAILSLTQASNPPRVAIGQ
jgi:hypothetical protein